MDMQSASTAHRTPGLTARQDDLLRYLIAREESGQGTPSFEEMKVALGLRSKSGIDRLVSALEERGHVKRVPNRARQITVTQPWSGPSLAHLSTSSLSRELRRRGWRVAQ